MAAAASSSDRIPPPTVSGRKISCATALIVRASAWRLSSVAVMSSTTTSSMPSTLYRRASSAGSPACRSCWNCTPLTTWPSRTSMQAMMRLVEHQAHTSRKLRRICQPCVARFLRVELHAEDVVALDHRRERVRVRRRGHALGCDRCGKGVREVHLRARGQSCEEPRGAAEVQASSSRRAAPSAADRRSPSSRAMRPAMAPSPMASGASSLPSNSHCIPTQMPNSGVPDATALPIASRHGASSLAVAPKLPTPGTMRPRALTALLRRSRGR